MLLSRPDGRRRRKLLEKQGGLYFDNQKVRKRKRGNEEETKGRGQAVGWEAINNNGLLLRGVADEIPSKPEPQPRSPDCTRICFQLYSSDSSVANPPKIGV